MSEESGNVQTAETAQAKSPLLPFGEVFAEMKSPKNFLSLEGTASIGKYWATFLLAAVPAIVLCSLLGLIAYAMIEGSQNPSGMVFTYAFYFANYAALFLALSFLVMIPVTVRRLREAGMPTVCAVAAVGIGLLPIPYFMWLTPVLMIVPGCLPAKKTGGESVCAKLNLSALVIWGMALAGVSLWVPRTIFGYTMYKVEKGFEEMGRQMEELKKEVEKDFPTQQMGRTGDSQFGSGGSTSSWGTKSDSGFGGGMSEAKSDWGRTPKAEAKMSAAKSDWDIAPKAEAKMSEAKSDWDRTAKAAESKHVPGFDRAIEIFAKEMGMSRTKAEETLEVEIQKGMRETGKSRAELEREFLRMVDAASNK